MRFNELHDKVMISFFISILILFLGLGVYMMIDVISKSNLWDLMMFFFMILLVFNLMNSFCSCGELHPTILQGIIIILSFFGVLSLIILNYNDFITFKYLYIFDYMKYNTYYLGNESVKMMCEGIQK